MMLGSGIHATIAGVLVAATVPARPKQDPAWLIQRLNNLFQRLQSLEHNKQQDRPILGEEEQHNVVENVQDAAEKVTVPLNRWRRVLTQPVALFVLPVFALANAGIPINSDSFSSLWLDPLAAGIIFGLVVGKGLGITLFCWITLRLNLGRLPSAVTIEHVFGLGLLGGMGFTMSIFISGLGFSEDHHALLIAKTAILIASLISGICGYLWLRFKA
jgi:NhaA family Na+:H+ antiporter